jgi:hypothetical protein
MESSFNREEGGREIKFDELQLWLKLKPNY